MITVDTKKNKLKSLLAGIGERLNPLIVRKRNEEAGITADKMKAVVLRQRDKRNKKNKNNLTDEEKNNLFQGPPVNAFKRHQQVIDIIKKKKNG